MKLFVAKITNRTKMLMPGRSLLWALIAGAIAVFPSVVAHSEEFPSEPLTIIIPWPPGGGADVSARMLAEPLQEALGVSVVIKNVAGAASATGMTALWREKADGHTVGLTYVQHTVGNEILNEGIPYKSREFSFVGQFASSTYTLAVPSSSEFKSLDDIVNAGRVIRICVPNAAGVEAMTMLFLADATNMKVSFVTGYAGAAPSILGAMKGECDAVSFGAALKGAIDAGDMVPLMAFDTERVPWFPDVPSISDTNVSPEVARIGSLDFVMWAPPGTPEDRLVTLQRALFTAADSIQRELEQQLLRARKFDHKQVQQRVREVFDTYATVSRMVKH